MKKEKIRFWDDVTFQTGIDVCQLLMVGITLIGMVVGSIIFFGWKNVVLVIAGILALIVCGQIIVSLIYSVGYVSRHLERYVEKKKETKSNTKKKSNKVESNRKEDVKK